MRLLVDTNVFLPLVEEQADLLLPRVREVLGFPGSVLYASVASLWEIAIKSRLGKLPLRRPILLLPESLQRAGMTLLAIEPSHVLADYDPQPATRDPFDRLLLAQCHVENLRLVTLDRALEAHPLAWQPA